MMTTVTSSNFGPGPLEAIYPLLVRFDTLMMEAQMPKVTLMTRRDDHLGDGEFDSIAWLFKEHLHEPDDPTIKSATVYGNEDYLIKVEFYATDEPLVNSPIVRTWKQKEDRKKVR